MKKYLIKDGDKYYKANLHCHTTCSDGRLSPQEIKELYSKHGYSIVAFTDHDVFIPHQDLTDENFVALNGFELEVNEQRNDDLAIKTCHVCYIAKSPDNIIHPMWHREKYTHLGNAKTTKNLVKFDESKPDFEREYSIEGVSKMMKIGRENGFFVTYNHPKWSLETYEQYAYYENMHAMEIVNGDCISEGFLEYNPTIYDEMLVKGKRIFCLATDDTHIKYPVGNKRCDAFIGFTMIRADKLNYENVTNSLFNGDFYSSRGPMIKNLWYDDEDNSINIECSDAKKITFAIGQRYRKTIFAEDEGKQFINSAKFVMSGGEMYVRVSVFDENDLTADTNAYFMDQIEPNEKYKCIFRDYYKK